MGVKNRILLKFFGADVVFAILASSKEMLAMRTRRDDRLPSGPIATFLTHTMWKELFRTRGSEKNGIASDFGW